MFNNLSLCMLGICQVMSHRHRSAHDVGHPSTIHVDNKIYFKGNTVLGEFIAPDLATLSLSTRAHATMVWLNQFLFIINYLALSVSVCLKQEIRKHNVDKIETITSETMETQCMSELINKLRETTGSVPGSPSYDVRSWCLVGGAHYLTSYFAGF